MPIPLRVPNFRLCGRLTSWMRENGVTERIPDREFVFFKQNLPVESRSSGLVSYAKQVGKLPAEMEAVIAQNPKACLQYANFLHKGNVPALPIPTEIVDGCCSDDKLITSLASLLNERIVRYEHKIDDPERYVEYASAVGRVPEMEERILFSEGDKHLQALFAFKLIERSLGNGYGLPSHPILNDERLKGLIKSNPSVVLIFMEFLGRKGRHLSEEFWEVFAGDGEKLWKLAEHLRRRLPEELERTWQGAKRELVQYAIKWIRGPLPEGMEDLLIGDTKAVSDYAFNVIRGFSSPKLGSTLHAFMLMSENDQEVRRYVAECDRIEEMKILISAGIEAAG